MEETRDSEEYERATFKHQLSVRREITIVLPPANTDQHLVQIQMFQLTRIFV